MALSVFSFFLIGVLLIYYPWILGISLGGFLIGFYFLDNVNEYVQNFFSKYSGVDKNLEGVEGLVPMHLLDPLLHTSPFLEAEPRTTTPTKENEVNTNHEQCTNNPTLTLENTCSVCDEENCPRSDEKKYSSPGQKRKHHNHESKEAIQQHQQQQQQFNITMIDDRLDKAISKFSKSVFDFYISSNWAPYETRKQLKLAFKKLLTNFAEKLHSNLIDEGKATMFCQDKVIPLLIHYIEKLRTSNNNSDLLKKVHHNGSAKGVNLEKMANLKTRRLCRQLLEMTLPQEDQQCRLWMELCVSVLSDGVLWNLILLGRDKLPNILLNYVEAYTQRSLQNITRPPTLETLNFICDKVSNSAKELIINRLRCAQSQSSKNLDPSTNSSNSDDNDKSLHGNLSNSLLEPIFKNCQKNQIKSTPTAAISNIIIKTENDESNQMDDDDDSHPLAFSSSLALPAKSTTNENKVPFLVNSFLDPSNDLEQPDLIASRWRPTLEEILVERELLYCLIQYLKGHRVLEYLQAVLDDSPDGNAYSRKVLQLEYLPGFCRSKIFMESLGISQVDSALEAGNDSPGSKRKHVRSSSYGGVSSGGMQMWKLGIGDPKAVDGLPLHTNPVSVTTTETDVLLNRRPHSVEVVIKKFLRSATKPPLSRPEEVKENLEDNPEPACRVGINPRTYEDLIDEDVISELIVAPWDIYDCTSEAVISWMNRQHWLQPIMTGWAQLLRHYLKSPMENAIKTRLDNFLSIETFVYCIDLVTEAFQDLNRTESEIQVSSLPPSVPNSTEQPATTGEPDLSLPPTQQQQQEKGESTIKIKESLVAALHWLFNQIVDPKTFAHSLKDNEDEIILFFVDLLDLLVKEVTRES